jgi:hypothetical protein
LKSVEEGKKKMKQSALESKAKLSNLRLTVVDLFSDHQSKLDEDSVISKDSLDKELDCFSSVNGS